MALKFKLPNDPHGIDVETDSNGNPVGSTPVYAGVEFRSNVGGLVQESYTDQLVAESGVFGDRHFKITLSARNIVASGGQAALGTTQGVYLCSANGSNTLGEYAVAATSYTRIDRVVLRVDDPSNGGAGDRTGYIEVIDGTPSASPTVPPVTGTNVWMDLAYITVPNVGGGSPSVTDMRKYTVATGGVRRVMKSSEVATAVPVGGIVYDDQANQYKLRKRTGWARLREVDDTGWVNVTLGSGWANAGVKVAQVRRIDGIVFLNGELRNDKALASGQNGPMLTIPSGYRPAQGLYELCQGSGKNIWLLMVNPDGRVMMDRYGTGSYSEAPIGTWFPFSTSWPAA